MISAVSKGRENLGVGWQGGRERENHFETMEIY